MLNFPKLKVVIFEEGNDIYHRNCSIVENKVKKCISCPVCAVMRGFGGAGAFSDGKYNLTTKFGSWLTDYLSEQEVLALIHYIDKINLEYGAPKKNYSSENSSIEKQALEHDLHLLTGKVRHLGTENNVNILKALYGRLQESVVMLRWKISM